MYDKLKDIAFRIHIEPLKTVEHAAKVETVIKVLSDIYESYNNYLEIEFKKNIEFLKAYERNNKVFDNIKNELSLLIVDLNFSSFEAALAPDILELQSPIFNNEIMEWKRDTYTDYKDVIINGNYEDSVYLYKVSERYNDYERSKIFKPLFSSFGNGKEYKLNIKDSNHKIIKTLVQPEATKNFYIPKSTKEKQNIMENETFQVFAKAIKDGDKLKLKANNILYYEKLEHDTYPFKPEIIKYESRIFILNKNLECKVEFEDESYIISNSDLDIIVWGETRKDAEEAFYFSFYSLYLNFYLETDLNLSEEAKLLKNKLKEIIKSVINEA